MHLFDKPKFNPGFPFWIKISFICLVLVKLWLVSGQTLCAIGYGMHDERLFINLAHAFLSGKWLGTYDNLTLIKGPFYPIYIAIVSILGMPLLLAQQAFYVAACFIFIIAIRPVMPRPVLLLVAFIFLLFNPMSYTDGVMTRVLREGIYPALTLFVVSAAIGLSVRYHRSLKSLTFWSIGLGFALSGYWLTREEGIWIVPSVLVLIGFASVRVWQIYRFDWHRLTLLYVLPFSIWLVAIGAVAGINKLYYGVFTTVEFKSSDFLSAYGALSRVRHEQIRLYTPVPRETRERIYQVSPAFAELKSFLEGDIGKGWTRASCRQVSVCDDISAGYFMWALRDAVAAAGYYSSGESAANYYRRVAEEINDACESGRLDCERKRASMMPLWHSGYIKPLLNKSIHAFIFLSRFDGFNPNSSYSEGNEESLLFFQNMTHERLSPLDVLQIHGWIIIPSDNIDLSIRTSTGDPVAASVEYELKGNAHKSYLLGGRENLDIQKKYFNITTNCTEGCYLHINKDDNLVTKIPLDGSIMPLKKPQIRLSLDFLGHKKIYLSSPNQSQIDDLKIYVLKNIGKAYQNIMLFLTGMSLIIYIINTINCFRRKSISSLWIINTSLIFAITAMIFLLSLIEVTSFPALNVLYLSPVYPLLSILPAFTLADLLPMDFYTGELPLSR